MREADVPSVLTRQTLMLPRYRFTRGERMSSQSQDGLYLVCGIHLLLHLILPPSHRAVSATMVGSFNKSKNEHRKVEQYVTTQSQYVVGVPCRRHEVVSRSPSGGTPCWNAFASNDTNLVLTSPFTSVNIFRCFHLCVYGIPHARIHCDGHTSQEALTSFLCVHIMWWI